ncbi:hypothetical protein P4U43_14940 [Arthrobacter sp. EH-1B-1]|uniref:DUF8175 domain-containing protein n=1 Tax=Arthrobacter vasquezii TaxID=2977629 RepID=A0ABT6CYG2_9MICC|nr:hypothetical protein [Arthrobacter vasquezii]MDF9279083.1 hypothetical protein [Arthrobacter vasquezii]
MSETTPDNKRNPFTRPGFILSAALIVALIAAVAVIAFLPRGDDEPDASTTAPSNSTPSSTGTPTEEETDESICGLPDNDETALGEAPESDWELVGTMAVPSAPETAGPGVADETGFRSCFAQTPTGALYAAANIWATGFFGDPAKLYQELAADSSVRDQALEAIANGEEVGSQNVPSMQIRGFILRGYTDQEATVDIAVETENGSFGSLPTPLVWEDGDWKINLPPTGNTGLQQLQNLNDYIRWGEF